jgi:monofunctional biosynthetic peptidoglycan transglycosylase
VFRINRKRLRRWLLRSLAALLVVSLLPVIVLRWMTPPTSAVMLARTLAEDRAQDYRWVPLERISPQVALAVVAAEDQKFPHHRGFDYAAIRDAARSNIRGERLRGASTLTQQVARNLFLWQGRSYLRKGLEAWLTALLELAWPKRRILEVYLNIAEMGEHSFGIEAASRRHFGQSANQLSREQAALIAAILPSPRRYRISNPSAYINERQAWILEQMELLGGTAYLNGIL